MAEKVEYELTLKDLFTEKVKEAKEAAENFHSVMDGVKKVTEAFGVDMSFLDPGTFLKKGIEGYQHLQTADAQLRNSMQTTGKYSEESFNKIVEGADKLSSHVLFSKSEIVDMQSHLALVAKIGNDQMGGLSETVADVATKLHIKIGEAGDMMARVINDPRLIGGFGKKLEISSGVIQSIKKLADEGNMAAARVMLIHAAQGKVAGSAKEAFDSDPLSQYNKQVEKAQEGIGEMGMDLLTALKPALDWFGARLNDAVGLLKKVGDWMKEHQTTAKILGDAIAGIAIGVIGWTAATYGLAAATLAWDIAMDANPIGLIVVGIMALIGALYEAYENIGWFRDGVNAAWDTIKDFYNYVKPVILSIGGFFSGLFDTIKSKVTDVYHWLKEKLIDPLEKFISKFQWLSKLAKGALRVGEAVETLGVSEVLRSDTYQKHLADEKAEREKEEKIAGNKNGKPTTTAVAPALTNKEKADAVISSPSKATGTKSVTINIAINKQIETLNIKTSNLVESASRIQERVAEALTNAVNQSQIIAGGR